MRKKQKQEILDFVASLYEAHKEIYMALEQGKVAECQNMLCDCQECAIELGNIIEAFEGEGAVPVSYIEKYCELLYHYYEKLSKITEAELLDNKKIAKKIIDMLTQQLSNMENSIKNDIKVKKEVVFFPYKASMWDSLESIYLAAKEDEECDTYCVPIPYYDRNPDGSFGKMHYEGGEYSSNIETVYWKNYDIKERRPDVVYIHNPYDDANYVTSVHPQYYSKELKKYTDCLVYVPYYATSGGMSEAQAWCPAYIHADYIVIQAEKYRDYFDKSIPDEKFLAFGSPKFDKIIYMCNREKEIPPMWKKQMEGKKIYFFNTSIGGMLQDTESYLKKMEYVFNCFRGKEDVCLVWRPHPLLESTFESMRRWLLPEYQRIKNSYINEEIGIYDDTQDMNQTIALCDVYIGDSATSVTSIFGIVGKPVFILNNRIHTKPENDDWKGMIITGFLPYRDDKWMVTQGNKLYYSPNSNYKYKFYCNLSDYAAGAYYGPVYEVNEKIYVCPLNAQDILVIENGVIKKKIALEKHLSIPGAFCDAIKMGHKIYLIPFRYPAIVIYDMEKELLTYIRGYQDLYTRNVEGEWRRGGYCVWKNFLMIASPVDNNILAIDSGLEKCHLLDMRGENKGGSMILASDGENIWSLPYQGNVITCWNPYTGENKEYKDIPTDFVCRNPNNSQICTDRPFSSIAFGKNHIYISPCWGNQFLCIEKESGLIKKWEPFYPNLNKEKNGYFYNWSRGAFIAKKDDDAKESYCYFSPYDCKLYDVDFKTEKYKEIEITFDTKDLIDNEAGFAVNSEWNQYACEENAINSLEDLINGTLKGKPHSKEEQIAAYGKVAANNDGTCGEKIHKFICG